MSKGPSLGTDIGCKPFSVLPIEVVFWLIAHHIFYCSFTAKISYFQFLIMLLFWWLTDRLCNMDILSHVQQVICFAFHDSRLLMETCQEARNLSKIVTLFYLDWWSNLTERCFADFAFLWHLVPFSYNLHLLSTSISFILGVKGPIEE